jgi:hypothetical protein
MIPLIPSITAKDHLLRRIDGFVTPVLAHMHERLQPYSSEIGRPSVNPELMIRMSARAGIESPNGRLWTRITPMDGLAALQPPLPSWVLAV